MNISFSKVFNQDKESLVLLEQLPIPTLILSDNLSILFSNISARKLYGFTENQFVENFKDLLVEEAENVPIESLFKLEQHKTLTNKRINVGVKYNRYAVEEDSCYFLQINDLSEIKKHQSKIEDLIIETHALSEGILKAQNELIQQEYRLNSLIHSQLNFLIRTDLEGNFTFVNKSFQSLFYVKIDNYSTQNISALIDAEDIHLWKNAIEKCLASPGNMAIVTLRMKLPNKLTVFVEWEFYTISIVPNEISEIQAVGNNITQKKAAEAELQKTLTLFTSVFNQSSDALFLINDNNNRIIDCNDTALHLFECNSKEEIIGENMSELEANPLNNKQQDSEEGNLNDKEKEILCKSKLGKHFWGNRIAKSIPFLNERITLVKITDVTEKKKKEEKINNLLKETLVFNDKLKANNNELNKLNKELDSFVYRISHDLRSPIASTMGLVNIAQIEDDKDKIYEYLNLIGQSMNKLDEFILDILDYSKNNRLEIIYENIDLKELVDELLLHFKPSIEDQGIKIINNIFEKTFIKSDVNRISIILNNLISNGIRYSSNYVDQSYIKLEVFRNETNFIFSVSDNGIGIPDQYQYDIFDMFFRVSNNGNGSGIGLYIVKETLLKLKGEITLKSIEGKGSTFNVILPIET